MNESIQKIIELLTIWGNSERNYELELQNGNTVQMCKEKGYVYYNALCKDFESGYAFTGHCVNNRPDAEKDKVLQKVKSAIIAQVRSY